MKDLLFVKKMLPYHVWDRAEILSQPPYNFDFSTAELSGSKTIPFNGYTVQGTEAYKQLSFLGGSTSPAVIDADALPADNRPNLICSNVQSYGYVTVNTSANVIWACDSFDIETDAVTIQGNIFCNNFYARNAKSSGTPLISINKGYIKDFSFDLIPAINITGPFYVERFQRKGDSISFTLNVENSLYIDYIDCFNFFPLDIVVNNRGTIYVNRLDVDENSNFYFLNGNVKVGIFYARIAQDVPFILPEGLEINYLYVTGYEDQLVIDGAVVHNRIYYLPEV